MEFSVSNANELFSEGLWKLKVLGVTDMSRNGPVIRIPEPVTITVEKPQERVLFHEGRDCNPYFHIFEGLWLIAGRNDVAFLKQFNAKIAQYSDDGKVFNASYGYRMRHHFGVDQLTSVIDILRSDPNSRQCVIQLWDPVDLNKQTLDKCCNTQLIFSVDDGRVNLTINVRSNDFWYGNSGANIVHFSMLLEFTAAAIGKPMGKMRTMVNNLHLYTKLYNALPYLDIPPSAVEFNHYARGVKTHPLVQGESWQQWLEDCENFCMYPTSAKWKSPFFLQVAYPLYNSWMERKAGGVGLNELQWVKAEDWQLAARQWIERREAAKSFTSGSNSS